MEYYNLANERYEKCLKSTDRKYFLKMELLSLYESSLDEITQDLSLAEQGQICVSNEQLLRKSCNFTLIDVDKKYLPNPSGLIWYGRKFKLWIGVQVNDDTYWFSQGVFVIQNAVADTNNVSIEAVDKGGLFDGTLGYNMVDVNYLVSPDVSIFDCIAGTLAMNMGQGSGYAFPIDPIRPIIDSKFRNTKIEKEVVINADSYLGELLTSLASDYCADVYYDNNGRLLFTSIINYSSSNPYLRMPNQWTYSDENSMYSARNISFSFDGINTVKVIANEVNQQSYEYTAYNKNPISPLRIGLVGIRRKETEEIRLTTKMLTGEAEKRCREYGNYILMKESMRGMQLNFESPIVPHLDVNKPIQIKDSSQNIDGRFVIQSLTIPLYAGNMSVSATDTDWLPSNSDAWRGAENA